MSSECSTILICGGWKSGKSSLINALLGEELLPTGSLPSTAVITELVFGEKRKLTAYPIQSAIPLVINNPTQEEVKQHVSFDKQDFFGDFAEQPANGNIRVVIECNNPILKSGIRLVEIPSLEFLWNKNYHGDMCFVQVADSYFPKADAIIYTMSSLQPYTRNDQMTIQQIKEVYTGEFLIACSRYDDIQSRYKGKERSQFRDSLLTNIYSISKVPKSSVIFVDTITALEAKLVNDINLYSSTGMSKIEKRIMGISKNQHPVSTKEMPLQSSAKQTIENAFVTLARITNTFGDSVAEPICKQLQSAKDRFEDEYLNLAVIGDFSCGKSTFLNALFGRDILSTDMQPTTAVPTYIRWNSTNRNFVVIAYDTHGTGYDLSTDTGKKKFEKLIHKQLPDDADRLIDAVTTDNTLCRYISKIDIKAPESHRFPNICLIDTPGVNPGTTGTEDHVRVTQNVLRNASDAAIIMFPADKVFTGSFKQFLEENANHLLNQSIFVITKSDTAKNDKTRADLVAFVEGHLEKMGILNPHVFCVSASCALDVYTGTDTSEKCRSFCSHFEETVNSIFGDLARRRSTIVYNNVHSVMEKVSKLLDTEIVDTTKALENSRNHMLLYSPENMEKECKKLLNEFNSDIGKVKTRYHNNSKDIVGAAIGSCRTTAFASINQKTNKTAVSDYVNQYDERDLYPVISAMTRHLNNLSAELKGKYERYSSDLSSCFRKYQVNIASTNVQNLQTINVEQISTSDVSVSVSGHITGSDIFDGIVDAVDEIFDSDDAFELVGNIAMGALVVAAGAVIGVVNALRSLDSIKEKARNDISAALESNRISLCEKLESNVTAYHKKYKDAATKLPGQLKSKYHSEYRKAMDKYQKEWADIEKQIEVQKDNLNALHALSKELDLK